MSSPAASASVRRVFAVIPAAGWSRRMGRPKLLLPVGETTVIGRLLTSLSDARIDPFVLIRHDDDALCAEVSRFAVTIVQPAENPPEMRASLEHLLRAIDERHHPQPDDGWLLIPADHPLLTADTLTVLRGIWQEHPASIVLPTYDGRRGHPTLFPWSLAASVFALPPDVGVNQLLHENPARVQEVSVNDSMVTFDLDTPEDYERLLGLV